MRFILAIISLLVIGWSVSALARFIPAAFAELSARSTAAEIRDITEQASSEQVEVEEVLLTPKGFEPAELNLPARRFILAIVNRSRVEQLSLRIDREAGGRLHEVRLPGGQVDWADSIDLPPGRYVLTEDNRPDWLCRIIISP
ncbi:MAG TPA: hypothetical protein VGX92_02625 [Pyrinomonadaceae bacterium]|nr:hypothetical protein [Pyrinomonadaceae bacterium]